MRIKTILTQYRRDFTATIECEHCGHETFISGYDDDNYHRNVIPTFECPESGKKAPNSYRPLATKYGPEEVI